MRKIFKTHSFTSIEDIYIGSSISTLLDNSSEVDDVLANPQNYDFDWSDRFLAYVTDTSTGGSDPHECAEFLRKLGVPPQEVWPYDASINTSEKFFAKPEPKIYEIAREFLEEFEFKHEYVARKAEAITEALKGSPLLISVHAWRPSGGRYIKPEGARDNHATTMFYERVGEFRRVFDTYDSPHIKDYDYKVMPEVIKRVWISKKSEYEAKLNLLEKIIVAIGQLIGLIAKPKPVAPQPKPQPIVEPVGSKLIEWATAIRDYEGKPGDLNYRLNNPGNIKGKNGKFLKFATWDEGWKYLLDYLTRATTGKHKSYKPEFSLLQFFKVYAPSADKNNPHAYASFVAKRLGVTVETQIKNLV